MLRLPIRLLLILTLVAALAQQAYATTVTIHTEDARATLLALQNRSLSHEDAMKIAEMHGNQAVLQKLHEFKITSTTQDFANALYATAHGEPICQAKVVFNHRFLGDFYDFTDYVNRKIL